MKTNKFLLHKYARILKKYKSKKRQSKLDESFELPENHFYNKMAQDDKIRIIKPKTRKIVPKPKQVYCELNVNKIEHLYETISKRNTLYMMPSTLRVMPLIPFWKTSFEIIENNNKADKIEEYSPKNIDKQPLYVTMRGNKCNEPIYV